MAFQLRIPGSMQLLEQQAKQLLDIDWVEIPAGAFIYGLKEDQREITVETFEITRFPITNVQYQCFIEDGGYDNHCWWVGLIKPTPNDWKQTNLPWDQADLPRRWIDWYEAVAFCRWFSSRQTQVIQLPTEQQWEKATRSRHSHGHLWRNGCQTGFVDIDETSRDEPHNSVEITTVEGLCPRGTSLRYSSKEMACDVWEWCLNTYDKPDDIIIDNRQISRVLRGGFGINSSDDVYNSIRFGHAPDYRIHDLGFRVVRISSISSIH